jgi:hypothetical protein
MYCPRAAKGFTERPLLRAQWIFIEAYRGPVAALRMMQIRYQVTACPADLRVENDPYRTSQGRKLGVDEF